MQNFWALGAPPPDPRASSGWGLCLQTPSLRWLGALPPDPHWPLAAGGSAPRPPKQPPPLQISGYTPSTGTISTLHFSIQCSKILISIIVQDFVNSPSGIRVKVIVSYMVDSEGSQPRLSPELCYKLKVVVVGDGASGKVRVLIRN